MPKYRDNLPQLDDNLFLTDGGLETTLIFHDGFELPHFAAFELLKSENGRKALTKYFDSYAQIGIDFSVGCVLETPTWRANPDWAQKLGYTPESLARANRDAVDLLLATRDKFDTESTPIVISGCLGPRGDGYNPEALMSVDEAADYHNEQIAVFSSTRADLVTAITMTHTNEALGLTQAALANKMPVVISFTVETDGSLPSGEQLGEAIENIDKHTDNAPVYYMINCAHPTHFDKLLRSDAAWTKRIGGLRANASKMSHTELDNAEELDSGDPTELAKQHSELRKHLKHLNVLGGCCGTDDSHIRAIIKSCLVE